MVILGLDQAPRCIGYAYGEPGAVPVWGLHENPDYGDNTARLGKHVLDWLIQFGKSIGAERIYFEQIIVRKHGLSMPVLHKQMRVAGAVEFAASALGIMDDCYEVDIGDWRREFYAGARPNKDADSESAAWKDMARLECANRGWLIEDHHIAEACGIWWYGCIHTDPRLKVQHKLMKRRAEHRADQRAA